jgi:hypothetical protein
MHVMVPEARPPSGQGVRGRDNKNRGRVFICRGTLSPEASGSFAGAKPTKNPRSERRQY